MRAPGDGEAEEEPASGDASSLVTDRVLSWKVPNITLEEIPRSDSGSDAKNSGSPSNSAFMLLPSAPIGRRSGLVSPTSRSSKLSLCSKIDFGYTVSSGLYAHSPDSRLPQVPEMSRMEALSHVGANFEDTNPIKNLQKTMRDCMQTYTWTTWTSPCRWLPIDKLFKIINETTVQTALEEAFREELSTNLISMDDIATRVAHICNFYVYEKKGRDGKDIKTSRRQIFAILAYMKPTRIRDIGLLLDAKMADIDLPFNLSLDREKHGLRLTSFSDPKKSCVLSKPGSEQPYDESDILDIMEYFEMAQKKLFMPFFEFNLDGKEVPFYKLPDAYPLPFVGEVQKAGKGTYSTVWRAQIHQKHHNLRMKFIRPSSFTSGADEGYLDAVTISEFDVHPDSSEMADLYNPEWAIKKLDEESLKDEDVRGEINSLVKVSGRVSERAGAAHVIKLFATYCLGKEWYLVFPWAEGDLLAFWKEQDPRKPPGDATTFVRWIASQCRCLAQGLYHIHRSRSDHKEWGIHRDIKPTNILRFRGEKMFWLPKSRATGDQLVIGDLGFTRFHGLASRSDAPQTGFSPTYISPEGEMMGKVSRACDIWSMACVYLEFITWYILGSYESVDEFSKLRVHNRISGMPVFTDTYFGYDPVSNKPVLLPAVTLWIAYLRSQDRCSKFFHHFLDLIQTGLFETDPNKRCNADELCIALKELERMCNGDSEAYCVAGEPRHMKPEDRKRLELPRKTEQSLPADARFGRESPYFSSDESRPEPRQHHQGIVTVLSDQSADSNDVFKDKCTENGEDPPMTGHRYQAAPEYHGHGLAAPFSGIHRGRGRPSITRQRPVTPTPAPRRNFSSRASSGERRSRPRDVKPGGASGDNRLPTAPLQPDPHFQTDPASHSCPTSQPTPSQEVKSISSPPNYGGVLVTPSSNNPSTPNSSRNGAEGAEEAADTPATEVTPLLGGGPSPGPRSSSLGRPDQRPIESNESASMPHLEQCKTWMACLVKYLKNIWRQLWDLVTVLPR